MKLDARTRLFIILAGIFSTCLIVGDIIGGKLVQTTMFGQLFTTTVGMIPFPVTFLLTDVLNEFYGKRAARFVTLLGFGLAVLSFVVIFIAARRRRGHLIADSAVCRASASGKFPVEFRRNGIIRGSGHLIIRRRRLGRHETNRCCTAGMTAKSNPVILNRRAKLMRSERDRQNNYQHCASVLP